MIIVKLTGGIGNQMFQYALGRKLALKGNSVLKFDIDELVVTPPGRVTPRQYALHVFDIQAGIADKSEIEKLTCRIENSILKNLKKLGFFKRSHSFAPEPHFHFYPKVLDFEDNIYVTGYWQTEKYFKDIEGVLRKDFSLKKEFGIANKEIAGEIRSNNAVSLHVRRDDYVTDPIISTYHGVCSLEYYRHAVEHIAAKVKNPVFYLFSDDMRWVKEHLRIHYPAKYVSDGILKDYEEMMLMSYCRHNIIANSSFSWWGAWLNANPGKMVIAPRPWFVNSPMDTSDVIPEEWTTFSIG